MNDKKIYSVSELTFAVKNMLEGRFPFISVAGEISNLRKPYSGHLYFTLKDDRAQIKAVLFKMQQRYLEQLPRDGQMVVCRGRLSVYEPRGDYQLIIDGLDFHGAGALQLAFEQLKKKLAAEGLFDQADKKEIPALPRHITLITSPTGAAVQDFIRIAGSRCPLVNLSIYPVSVQGEAAAGEIRQAIVDINTQLDTDAIVLCRGGGSIEDLWAFNDEQLARTIRQSSIPVISAVGHEIDFTIADFAADLRAPTPSGAAEILVPDKEALADRVQTLRHRLSRTIQTRLETLQNRLALLQQHLAGTAQPVDTMMMRLDHLSAKLEQAIHQILTTRQTRLEQQQTRLQHNTPLHILHRHGEKVQTLHQRLELAMIRGCKEKKQALGRSAALLDAVSPLSTLARGYAVARKKITRKTVLTSVAQVSRGEEIEIILHRGSIDCSVLGRTDPEKIKNKK
jgi:exodeoxyribonuclease VII large subunit